VLLFWGWRAIFWVLAGIGAIGLVFAWLRLPETLKPEYRQPLHLGSVVGRFGTLLKHRAFMATRSLSTFQFCALTYSIGLKDRSSHGSHGYEPRKLEGAGERVAHEGAGF